MMLRKKNVCYLIFTDYPSSVVRGKTFKSEYDKHIDLYNVTYFNLYSTTALVLSKYFKRLNLGIFEHFFLKLNSLIRLIKSRIFLLKCNQYDGIIIIKNINIKFFLELRKSYNNLILYDFDDAIWLNSNLGFETFRKIISDSDFVSCDNQYLLGKSLIYNSNSFIFNGPTQVEKFIKVNNNRNDDKIVIGWIGSPDTLFYLYSIYSALESIGKKFPQILLKIVGAGSNPMLIPPFENINYEVIEFYDEEIMINEVVNFDIGIFPLYESELSYGRGFLKARIYMSASVPVVCSGLKIKNELITHNKDGFICYSNEDWIYALSNLIENKEIRLSIGEQGFKLISNLYSKESCFNELKSNFLCYV